VSSTPGTPILADQTAPPPCPRCGYDLRGAAQDWVESCPLRGVCPECGLKFSWREVFSPERQDLPWFFEHAGRTRELPGRLVWTFVRALWPTWFWAGPRTPNQPPHRGVRLEHRTRVWMTVLWAVLMLGVLHAAASTLSTARWVIIVSQGLRQVNLPAGQAALVNAGGGLKAWSGDDTLRVIGSWTHPVAQVYELGPRPGIGGLRGFGRAGGPGGAQAPPAASGGGLLGLAPLGFTSSNTVFPWYVHVGLGVHMGFALVLLALPHTRAMSGLRLVHVLRALLYGLSWVGVLALFRVVRNAVLLVQMLSSGARAQASPIYLIDLWPETIGVVVVAWVGLWWLAAMTRGWRLRGAMGLYIVLAIPAGLLGAVAYVYLSEYRLF
jgi:hypothetical protein